MQFFNTQKQGTNDPILHFVSIYILEVIWETKCSPSPIPLPVSKLLCCSQGGFLETIYWTHGSVQQILFYRKSQQNSKSTQGLGFFSLNKVSSLLQISKPLVSYQNKMNCHHYAMDHFSLTILYVSSCRFVSFHNKCIMLRTCCISCWDSDSKRFPRMGADCAGDASIQHSISSGIIISIKPFKFSAEDRPFSALSITLVRDLNNKGKKKKRA